MIFKEATRSVDDDEQTAPELFRVGGGGSIMTKPHTAKGMALCLGNETARELQKKKKKKMSPVRAATLNRTCSISLLKL